MSEASMDKMDNDSLQGNLENPSIEILSSMKNLINLGHVDSTYVSYRPMNQNNDDGNASRVIGNVNCNEYSTTKRAVTNPPFNTEMKQMMPVMKYSEINRKNLAMPALQSNQISNLTEIRTVTARTSEPQSSVENQLILKEEPKCINLPTEVPFLNLM